MKSTHRYKLQPVVDLVQVVNRPFKSSNSLLHINADDDLTFEEGNTYSIRSKISFVL